MPDDEKFNEFIRRHAAGYRADGPVPADELWGRIETDVADAIASKGRGVESASHRSAPRIGGRTWLVAGAALAAALVLGVGIGRWTKPRAPMARQAVRIATHDDSLRRVTHLRATAYDHLGETEVFLTEVRSDLRAGRGDADRAERSRELLARTRLLLQSREAQGPAVTRLLEDLELLLAEIAALPENGRRRSADAALVEETLTQNDIIPRIRTTLPARNAGT